MVRDKLLIAQAEIDALHEATKKLGWETQLQLLAFRYRNGDDGLSGPKIRAALPAELVHRPGTMAYSCSISRNK